MGTWKGRGNQYIQFVRFLYCKLLTNGKQLPAFPLEALPGTEPRPQRWEARVLPLCHSAPPPPISDLGLWLMFMLRLKFGGYPDHHLDPGMFKGIFVIDSSVMFEVLALNRDMCSPNAFVVPLYSK